MSDRIEAPKGSGAIDVLYLDNHLLVVSKPAGLLVQADATGDVDLLTLGKQFLKKRFDKPGQVFLALVHRLDRPVSGVMVLARTSKAAARLSEQIRNRVVAKRYCAVVDGRMLGEGHLHNRIRKQGGKARIVGADDSKGAEARMHWRSLAEFNGRTLVDVVLETGRPHQIRLQLASAGYGVAGDRKHGSSSAWVGRSIALHCYAMAVKHPTRGQQMLWCSKPTHWPSDWSSHLDEIIQEAETRFASEAVSDADGKTTT